MVKVGLLRADQAKLEEAEKLVRDGLATIRRTLPSNHPSAAGALDALGHVLQERGSYKESIAVLDEAVRLRSGSRADQSDLAGSLLELANAHFYAGQHAESEKLNRRVLAIHRQLHGERHPLVAGDLINLGAIQQELGFYDQAERFHREALEITRAYYGEEHHKTASSLTLVARALLFQKRYNEAAALLERAVRIQEKVFGPVHPRVASAVNELGNIALMRQRYDDAEAAYRRVVNMYREIYAGKHYLVGVGLSNLASAFMARKDHARAEPLFREALAMFAQTLPPDHLNVAIGSIKLGRVLRRQNRMREAEAHSLRGYEILSAQANPSVTWLKSAREDLAAIYAALGDREKARKFEAELK